MDKHPHPEIIVAIYQLSSERWDYYQHPAYGNLAIKRLVENLPGILASEPSAPKLNAKTMQQLESKLRNALKEFATGSLADVKVYFPLGDDIRSFGFHRMPVSADQAIKSVLTIAMNRFGHLSEMRCRPTAEAIAVKAAAFGGEVPHVH